MLSRDPDKGFRPAQQRHLMSVVNRDHYRVQTKAKWRCRQDSLSPPPFVLHFDSICMCFREALGIERLNKRPNGSGQTRPPGCKKDTSRHVGAVGHKRLYNGSPARRRRLNALSRHKPPHTSSFSPATAHSPPSPVARCPPCFDPRVACTYISVHPRTGTHRT